MTTSPALPAAPGPASPLRCQEWLDEVSFPDAQDVPAYKEPFAGRPGRCGLLRRRLHHLSASAQHPRGPFCEFNSIQPAPATSGSLAGQTRVTSCGPRACPPRALEAHVHLSQVRRIPLLQQREGPASGNHEASRWESRGQDQRVQACLLGFGAVLRKCSCAVRRPW